MRRLQATSLLILLMVSSSAAQGVVEKVFPFPPPVQWMLSEAEVSIVGLAWGPANSTELIAKGRRALEMEKPRALSDRTYALAIALEGRVSKYNAPEMTTCSGLIKVKNVNGEFEGPSMLTPTGFLPVHGPPVCALDIHFQQSNSTKSWIFFPVLPGETEFLFQVVRGGAPIRTLLVSVQKGNLSLTSTSAEQSHEPEVFEKKFTGEIGPQERTRLKLIRKGTVLSGTLQDERGEESTSLTGDVDSLGNFILKEKDSRGRASRVFKGRSSDDFRSMTGFSARPDGTRLRAFEFREVSGDE